jgi:small GTP-binding protein
LLKFKIIVAGAKGVGKTSLIRRFCTGKFDISTLSTIGVDFETKEVVLDNDVILFNIWDFAGEEKFRILFPSYVSGASGALVLYDITNRDSLDDLVNWIEIIESVPDHPNTLFLIGTKLDLEENREVSSEEALKFHKKFNFKGDITETSSKSGINIEETFIKLGKEILQCSLIKCKHCGEFFPQELIYCQFCGNKKG